MIRHIVFFSVPDAQNIDRVIEGLNVLRDIPHSSKFEVVKNSKVDPLSDVVDVVVYGEFADDAALAAFKAHPNYQASINLVRPLREMRISADFRSEA